MSNVNIMRAVENIRSGTNIYTPLVEAVVNAIQAVEEKNGNDGLVRITVERSAQGELDSAAPDVVGFEVSDNGIGFTEKHRTAFDTLYTTQKIAEGGKGFGRFTYLKYYTDVLVDSRFQTDSRLMQRTFRMGTDKELIVDEEVVEAKAGDPGSTVRLTGLRQTFPDKGLGTIGRVLVEKLLPYFISEDRECPRVLLIESDGSERIVLNDYLSSIDDPLIVEETAARGEFVLESTDGEKRFQARVFRLYSPRTKRSRVSLVAHRREVTATSLHVFIPEFTEEFYDQIVSMVSRRTAISLSQSTYSVTT